jgi:hypothetical protein
MLIIIAFVLGTLFGWWRAKHRGGDRFDCLQYAAAHGILFALVTLVLLVALERFGVI